MSDALVIYHGNCNDGFAAAWCAWQRYGQSAEYVPAQYGQEPPDPKGRVLWILDFSYPRETLLKLAAKSCEIHVLDHHKTAEADLAGLDFCKFDMSRSGAGMTWDEFHEHPRPWFIEAVQDRDLWLWKLEDSHELNAAITTWPRDFKWWDNQYSWGDTARKAAIGEGVAIRRYIDRYTDEMVAQARRVEFEGYRVPCINVPYNGISEIVGKLAEDQPFAIGWFQGVSGKYLYSLRSKGDFDVSAIAKKYGGGGHKNSAGFNSDKLLF
jgi:uncharacterized protein